MCPEAFSCSPSSSLTEVFGGAPNLSWPPCPSGSLLQQGSLPVPRGSGHRDVLLQAAACSTQDTGLFAFRLQRDMEESHGDPEESMWQTHSLPVHGL